MNLVMNPAINTSIHRQWMIGLPAMLFSLIVLAENAGRLDISPVSPDDRLANEIYNSASGWRSPPEFENEWRPEKQERVSRIQFGYDSAYEEMRARDNNFALDTGSSLADQPQNTQFKIGF